MVTVDNPDALLMKSGHIGHGFRMFQKARAGSKAKKIVTVDSPDDIFMNSEIVGPSFRSFKIVLKSQDTNFDSEAEIMVTVYSPDAFYMKS